MKEMHLDVYRSSKNTCLFTFWQRLWQAMECRFKCHACCFCMSMCFDIGRKVSFFFLILAFIFDTQNMISFWMKPYLLYYNFLSGSNTFTDLVNECCSKDGVSMIYFGQMYAYSYPNRDHYPHTHQRKRKRVMTIFCWS